MNESACEEREKSEGISPHGEEDGELRAPLDKHGPSGPGCSTPVYERMTTDGGTDHSSGLITTSATTQVPPDADEVTNPADRSTDAGLLNDSQEQGSGDQDVLAPAPTPEGRTDDQADAEGDRETAAASEDSANAATEPQANRPGSPCDSGSVESTAAGSVTGSAGSMATTQVPPDADEVTNPADRSTDAGLLNDSQEQGSGDQDVLAPAPTPEGRTDDQADAEGDRETAAASEDSANAATEPQANRPGSPCDSGSVESIAAGSVTGPAGSMMSRDGLGGQVAFPELTVHPIADIFPPPTPQELEGIAASIVAHRRLLVPILVYQSQIVDGRHRYEICRKHGIIPSIQEWDGHGSLIDIAIDLNAARRNMDDAQRALAAARLANMDKGRPKKNAQIWAVSQAKAAELLRVSRTCVQLGKRILDRGAPELITAVERGEMAITVAAELAELPSEQQIARLAEHRRRASILPLKARRFNVRWPCLAEGDTSASTKAERARRPKSKTTTTERSEVKSTSGAGSQPREARAEGQPDPLPTAPIAGRELTQHEVGRHEEAAGIPPRVQSPKDQPGPVPGDIEQISDQTEIFLGLCEDICNLGPRVLAELKLGINDVLAFEIQNIIPGVQSILIDVCNALIEHETASPPSPPPVEGTIGREGSTRMEEA